MGANGGSGLPDTVSVTCATRGSAVPARGLGAAGAFLAGLAFMLATMLPYYDGLAHAPSGTSFTWVHTLNGSDLQAHLALIARAQRGELLLKNNYTVDLPNRGLFRPLFLVMGLVSRATGSPIAAFHATRVLLGALLLAVLYAFARSLGYTEFRSRLVLLLAAIGSGLGWLFGRFLPDGLSPDLAQAEATIFASLYDSPHFAFPLLLWCASLLGLRRSILLAADPSVSRARFLLPAVVAGAATSLLLFEHPFDTITCFAVAFLTMMWGFRSVTRSRMAEIGCCYYAIAAIAPAVVQVTVRLDPVLQLYARQNEMPSPPPLAYLVGFGLLWPLSLYGFIAIRRRVSFAWVLLGWSVAGYLFVYVPVPYQRRMAEGWQIPLVLLGAAGLGAILERVRERARVPLAVAFIALLALSPARIILEDLRLYRTLNPNVYVDSGLISGIDAMAPSLDYHDAVLATPGYSWLISGRLGCHVLAGHPLKTVVVPETREAIESGLRALALRAPQRDIDRLLALCRERRIRYVVFDSRASGAPPGSKGVLFGSVILVGGLDWKVVHEGSAVTVYAVPMLRPPHPR